MGIPNSNSLNNLRSLLILVAIAYLGKNMENFKLIPLGKSGKFAIVDEEDYEWLSQWKWRLGNGYAVRSINRKTTGMHRVINQTPEGLETDHINRNKLDNRKSNLRSATRSANSKNRALSPKNVSGCAGVSWSKDKQAWLAITRIEKKRWNLGCFEKMEDAKRALTDFLSADPKDHEKIAASYKKIKSNNDGVCWDKNRQNWIAYYCVNRKTHRIGGFKNKEDAIAARKNWELSQSDPSP